MSPADTSVPSIVSLSVPTEARPNETRQGTTASPWTVAPSASVIDTLVSGASRIGDRRANDRHAVRTQFGERISAEAIGRGRVAGGEAVELVDGRVAVRLVVDHGDPVPGPGEHECCREPGGAAADDDHVAGDGAAVAFMTPTPPPRAAASATATCGR